MSEIKLANQPPHSSPSPPQRFHGVLPIRGLEDIPRSTLYEGRFGRMFRNLPPFAPDDADLLSLGALMIETQAQADDPPRNFAAAFNENTPLWFYILKEAEVRCSGKKLGPVGGRIVAEVLVGLLDGDLSSFLNVEPTWQPKQGQFRRPSRWQVFHV